MATNHHKPLTVAIAAAAALVAIVEVEGRKNASPAHIPTSTAPDPTIEIQASESSPLPIETTLQTGASRTHLPTTSSDKPSEEISFGHRMLLLEKRIGSLLGTEVFFWDAGFQIMTPSESNAEMICNILNEKGGNILCAERSFSDYAAYVDFNISDKEFDFAEFEKRMKQLAPEIREHLSTTQHKTTEKASHVR